MDTKQLQQAVNQLEREFKVVLNNIANVYQNALGTGLALEYYDNLMVQFDLFYNQISFVVIDEQGQSSNLKLFDSVSWNNNYKIDHICHLIREFYEKYHAQFGGPYLLKLPNLKDF